MDEMLHGTMLFRLKVDDVVQASAVHLGCGSWGLTASGLLTTSSNYDAVYSYGVFAEPGRGDSCCGCEEHFENCGIVFDMALRLVRRLAWVCSRI